MPRKDTPKASHNLIPQDAVDPAPPVHPHRPLGGARSA